MTTQLTDEQRHAVDQHHGFLEVEGGGTAYVVMSMQVYREMMGVGSEAGYRASVEAIREGLKDVEAGRTRPIDEFFQDLDRKHVDHRPLDPVRALLDRRLGQTHQDGLRQPGRRDIDLDFDRQGLDAQQREGLEFGQHGPHCTIFSQPPEEGIMISGVWLQLARSGIGIHCNA